MTGENENAQEELNRLADALVEDILSAPDDELLADFREDGYDPQRNATELRELFRRSLLAAKKRRMSDAKAGVAAVRQADQTDGGGVVVDIAAARARLQSLIERHQGQLTMAARNEGELSDADVLGMLKDFAELGLFDPDE